jgi:hypothetical protein
MGAMGNAAMMMVMCTHAQRAMVELRKAAEICASSQ